MQVTRNEVPAVTEVVTLRPASTTYDLVGLTHEELSWIAASLGAQAERSAENIADVTPGVFFKLYTTTADAVARRDGGTLRVKLYNHIKLRSRS